MGAVYLAYDKTLKSRVALKTLRRVDASGIYLFKREFRALADLVHPNLVRLHELFSQGQEWFFTMEYVRGRTFLDYVLGGTLPNSDPMPRSVPPKEYQGPTGETDEFAVDGLEMLFPSPLHSEERLRDVLAQITQGVLAVHEAGKLHRDLKSENVMVTDDGRALVLDFGVVVERTADIHGTIDPTVFGTPAYMSPEQAAGSPIDEASDWYALGVMMYEAFTGSLPFDGSYHEVLANKQNLDPPPPGHIVSGVPEDLDALCMELLSREPSQRPNGRSILRRIQNRDSITVPPRASKPPPPDDTAFVGREPYLQQLTQALARTDAGRPVLSLVSGASGIGKTTVVERFLHLSHHRSDAVVLKGRCYERESVPFKAIDSLIDSLCRYLRRLPPIAAVELMPREIHALSQVFPVLNRVDVLAKTRRRHRAELDPQAMRSRAFSALRELFARMADRSPVVLFIDDLQWGDLDSTWMLLDLLRGEDAPAVQLICSFRTGEEETSACVKTLIDEALLAQVDVIRSPVEPLNSEDSIRLITSLLPTDSVPNQHAIALQREAGGSPYLLTELVRHATSQPGQDLPTFHALVSNRIQSLEAQAKTLLQLVAVAGRPVSEEVLALASTFDINLHVALLDLRTAKLIRGVALRDNRAVEVYHNRIREVILSEIPASDLRQWNRRLATTLEATGSDDLEALVAHLLGAEDFARAGIYALRAAEQAANALAFDKAARLYEVAAQHGALEGAEREELMEHWAAALVSAGRGAEAATRYFEASQLAAEPKAAQLRERAGVQLLAAGKLEQGARVLKESLKRSQLTLGLTRGAALERTALLRGQLLNNGLRIASEAPPSPAPPTLERLDLLWAIGQALVLHESARAMPLLHQFLVEALQSGNRHRIVKGLCMCDAVAKLSGAGSANGPKADALKLAETLLQDDAPSEVRGMVHFARAMRLLNTSPLSTSVTEFVTAERHFRDEAGLAMPATRLCRTTLISVRYAAGDSANSRDIDRWLREADACGDQILSSRLRILTAYPTLLKNDVQSARRLCTAEGLDLADDDIATLNQWLMASSVALYSADTDHCLAQLHAYDRVKRSTLKSIHFFASYTSIMAARLRIASSQPDSNATLHLARTELKTATALQVYSLEPVRCLAQAGLEASAGNLQLAESLLKQIETSAPDHAHAVATYLLDTQFGHSSIRRTHAENELNRRGIESPSQFANLFYPGPIK